MLSKQHFQAAAAQVDAIRSGKWTDELPDWAPKHCIACNDPVTDPAVVRAVQTAEAYILLFSQYNPLFDVGRFLYACGLGPKPAKGKRR